jgi:ribosome-binding protein aMBF1 (putative translation factor)
MPESSRTPEELARSKAERERYQAAKPGLHDVAKAGGVLLPLGQVMALQVLGATIRSERQRQRLTLEQLAAKAGIDAPALSRIERGRNPNPTVETLSHLARALGKTLSIELHDPVSA